MDYRALFAAPLAALVLSVGAAPAPLQMPDGWQASRYAATKDNATASFTGNAYEIGIDTTQAGQPPALTLRSIVALNPDSVANVGHAYQTITGYGGQRLRFSGQVRATTARGWAGLYMGLGDDDVLGPVMRGEPGIEKRLPLGAAVPAADGAWHEVSVVLDVPAGEPFVGLGMAQVDEGQFWVRDLKFEVVGPEVPVTTTPIGIDWARVRQMYAKNTGFMKMLQPMPLRNTALD